jgi:hypothetical protein
VDTLTFAEPFFKAIASRPYLLQIPMKPTKTTEHCLQSLVLVTDRILKDRASLGDYQIMEDGYYKREERIAALDSLHFWIDVAIKTQDHLPKALIDASHARHKNLFDLLRNEHSTLRISEGMHNGPTKSVIFSPDGQRIASTSDDAVVRLWNPYTGECTAEFGYRDHRGSAAYVSFSSDGQCYVATYTAGANATVVTMWNLDSKECVATLGGHTTPLSSFAFSGNHHRIVTGTSDGSVRIWDSHTCRCLAIGKDHTNWITSISLSPDGKYVASSSIDKTVKLWYAHTGRLSTTLFGHSDWIVMTEFSTDGKRVLTVDTRGDIRLWDTETSELLVSRYSPKPTILPEVFPLPWVFTLDSSRKWLVATSYESQEIVSGPIHQLPLMTRDDGLWPAPVASHGTMAVVGTKDGRVLIIDVRFEEFGPQRRYKDEGWAWQATAARVANSTEVSAFPHPRYSHFN